MHLNINELKELTPIEKVVLQFIAGHLTNLNDITPPLGYDIISKGCNISRSSVIRVIKNLLNKDFISVGPIIGKKGRYYTLKKCEERNNEKILLSEERMNSKNKKKENKHRILVWVDKRKMPNVYKRASLLGIELFDKPFSLTGYVNYLIDQDLKSFKIEKQ
jgi:hypothetical protein